MAGSITNGAEENRAAHYYIRRTSDSSRTPSASPLINGLATVDHTTIDSPTRKMVTESLTASSQHQDHDVDIKQQSINGEPLSLSSLLAFCVFSLCILLSVFLSLLYFLDHIYWIRCGLLRPMFTYCGVFVSLSIDTPVP